MILTLQRNNLFHNPVSGLWTPALISTELWLDASDASTITETGGSVSQWDDKSGNGKNLIQSNGAWQPTYDSVNKKVINNGNRFMSVDLTIPMSGNISVFSVVKVDTVTSNYNSIFAMNATPDFDFQLDANNTSQFNGRINVSGIGLSVALTGGPFMDESIYNVVFDYDSGFYTAFVNGTKRADNTAYTTKLGTSQNFRIFTNRSISNYIIGKISEIILIENCSDNCRQIVESYLAWKWGTASSLPINHPYKFFPPRV